MIGWQTIETAPMDGTPILGFADGDMTTVAWFGGTDGVDGYWSLVVSGWNASNSEWNPTHWMPLPDAPALHDTKGITGTI